MTQPSQSATQAAQALTTYLNIRGLRDGQILIAIAQAEARGREECRPFMRHDGLCAAVGGYGYCNCGLEALINKEPPHDQ